MEPLAWREIATQTLSSSYVPTNKDWMLGMPKKISQKFWL